MRSTYRVHMWIRLDLYWRLTLGIGFFLFFFPFMYLHTYILVVTLAYRENLNHDVL